MLDKAHEVLEVPLVQVWWCQQHAPQSLVHADTSIVLCSQNTLIVWFYMGKDDTQA